MDHASSTITSDLVAIHGDVEFKEATIFTYNNRDGFVPNIESNPNLTTSETTKHLPLTEAIPSLQRRQNTGNSGGMPLTKSAAHVQNRLTEGNIIETMYVMAAVDTKMSKWEKGGKFDTTNDPDYHQQVLCALKLHKNGLLEVTPGFSSIDERLQINPSLLTLPLDMDPAHRITTFTFTSPEGSLYEYSIINEFAVSNIEAEKDAKLQLMHDHSKLYERDKKLYNIGGRLLPTPSRKNDKPTMHGFVEIVSASVLEYDGSPISCNCHLSTPKGWVVSSNETGTSNEDSLPLVAAEIIPLNNRRPWSALTAARILGRSFEASATFFLAVFFLQLVSQINSLDCSNFEKLSSYLMEKSC
eukprot:CAMPEP_0116018558 /NCGR_PEP_ID=MMETSP0321-20121206/8714_1 /TAXON_ID=163516 /ORGANISM="Leptocylindrus danicus var. danicus, Strain B650" /LENGTH=356 /DNA_ID=CAMNT_0003488963 /DNA_START=389 /DNA_END=1459 /DNA_ORIENTATION=-